MLRATLCRGENADELLQELQVVLSRRAWLQLPPSPAKPLVQPNSKADNVGAPGDASTSAQLRAEDVGVAGILRRQEAAQQSRGRSMEEAFTDLRALVDKAKDMMAFAERIRESMLRDTPGAESNSEELEARGCGDTILRPPPRPHLRAAV